MKYSIARVNILLNSEVCEFYQRKKRQMTGTNSEAGSAGRDL
jgi:hypothetical protein